MKVKSESDILADIVLWLHPRHRMADLAQLERLNEADFIGPLETKTPGALARIERFRSLGVVSNRFASRKLPHQALR
jgi:hypothetical protein